MTTFWSKLKDSSNIDKHLVIYKMSFTNLGSVVRGQNAIVVATYVQTHGRTYQWTKGLIETALLFKNLYLHFCDIFDNKFSLLCRLSVELCSLPDPAEQRERKLHRPRLRTEQHRKGFQLGKEM